METRSSVPEGLPMAASTMPPAVSTAPQARKIRCRQTGRSRISASVLERAGIDDAEVVDALPGDLPRRRVLHEEVERVPVERRLLRPIGTGEGRQLRCIDAGGNDVAAGKEDRPR